MGDKELTPEELQSFKQELADIKADMMRNELEEIKREHMKKELEEIKREKESAAGAPKRVPAPVRVAQPQLSLVNVLFAAVSLLLAGYLIGTLFALDVTTVVDGLLTGYGLPAVGNIVIIAAAVLLALFGTGMITIAKK